MDKDEMWEELLTLGVSEQSLQLITSINGYSRETMLDVLQAHTGYRTFEQLEDEEAEEPDILDTDLPGMWERAVYAPST